MPNHHPLEIAQMREQEIAQLKDRLAAAHKLLYEAGLTAGAIAKERDAAIAGNAKVIHALDCAIQWAEALFAWLPEGTVMPDGIKAARENLTRALRELRR